MSFYLIRFRPFKNELLQILNASDEISIVFCIIGIYFLYFYNSNTNVSFNLSMIIVGLILANTVKNLFVIWYVITLDLYKKLKLWVHKKVKILIKIMNNSSFIFENKPGLINIFIGWLWKKSKKKKEERKGKNRRE